MPKELELTLMLADYHRTRPILSGEVSAEGIKLAPRRAIPGEAVPDEAFTVDVLVHVEDDEQIRRARPLDPLRDGLDVRAVVLPGARLDAGVDL